MYFKNLSAPRKKPVFLWETLRFLEARFKVVITIHDCFGKLAGPDGEQVLEPYMIMSPGTAYLLICFAAAESVVHFFDFEDAEGFVRIPA